ncbi:DNA mismatch repair protein MutS [Bythopirellula polymerisocia]|uniref:DNA mismatch repair protein MutS n=1 Tax=Bythopirellula polymerisocia TaxID=2528003 RepID=A0A5C6C1H2_9BACT|nr:DNA mismatch repair protein MutS [Bythopirellula polymerisocia]TWU17817.1 DNA mismatch repair protein MutS [Bythopirellula polymerisocia]
MSVTPMMQQYHEAKEAAGDALLLFRMGDFYELFFEDAKTAARVLGLSLTSRDKGENPVAMAGFPHHQLDSYLTKIISAGLRAAVCEQMEDPRQAKGIVKRAITRVVSRGTVTDDALLNPAESNFLLAISRNLPKSEGKSGLAWIDISTGRFEAAVVSTAKLDDELARIAPVELLVSDDSAPLPPSWSEGRLVTRRPAWAFGSEAAQSALTKHFGTQSLSGFGFEEDDSPALSAAGAVLDYLTETQKSSLDHIASLFPYRVGNALEIDQATRRSLEISQSLREGRREGSLLGVVDSTVTAMGARLLGDWFGSPLTDVERINARLDAVGELVVHPAVTAEVRTELKAIYDMQRLLARVTTGRATPRDLCFVARTLSSLPKVKAKLTGRSAERLALLESRIDLCADIRGRLEAALEDDCPLTTRDGGFIRSGFHAELDEQRELMRGGKRWMAEYQARAVEESGIPSIKVGFNKVFGYYLEVTHTHREKVPANFIRKQTLKNAERFITPELKEHEEKVLAAEERSQDLEYELFVELRELVASATRRLQGTAEALAEIDVLASMAELARTRNYVRPEMSANPVLDIEEGRHPVLDITEPEGTFVPNDVSCKAQVASCEEREIAHNSKIVPRNSLLLITGPNMAGKSTYIRQVALITLLAQVGSFVPAKRATIGVADRIFARVGASDDLARGRSTFMVEMTETARILNTATERSLVILDEIGRGTSTYDGLSLAWAVVEYLHDRIGCRTLFATHYHELTDLEATHSGVQNLNVAVQEWQGEVVFLHQIVPGAADKSYGIHVAKLAGVPREVNQRAEKILAQLETQHEQKGSGSLSDPPSRNGHPMQMTLFETMDHPLLETIRGVQLDSTTPLEAFQMVKEWQEQLAEKKVVSRPK